MRELGEIVTEITINGETFIPIVKLAKIFNTVMRYNVTHFDNPRIDSHGRPTVNCCVENDSFRYQYYQLDPDMGKNEYRVVKQLIEWGFKVD